MRALIYLLKILHANTSANLSIDVSFCYYIEETITNASKLLLTIVCILKGAIHLRLSLMALYGQIERQINEHFRHHIFKFSMLASCINNDSSVNYNPIV